MGKDKEFLLAGIFLISFAAFFVLSSLTRNINKSMQSDNFQEISVLKSDITYGNGEEDKIISEKTTINAGVYEYKNFILNGELSSLPGTTEQAVTIRAKEKIVISKNAKIDLSGGGNNILGSQNGEYAGNGGNGAGRGGSGDCLSNNTVEPDFQPNLSMFYGKSGEIGEKTEGVVGRGGGFIAFYAPEIIIEGDIVANGQKGQGSGGGGGGGKVIIIGDKISLSGSVSAQGGNGGSSQIQGAGGGGGGLVMISKYSGKGSIVIDGGKGGEALDLYTGCNGKDGSSGKIYLINFK